MGPTIVFANLSNAQNQQLSIRFHDIEGEGVKHAGQAGDIWGIYLISESPTSSKQYKAHFKSAKAAGRVAYLLNSRYQTNGNQRERSDNTNQLPTVALTDKVMMRQLPYNDPTNNSEGMIAFQEVEFSFESLASSAQKFFTSTQLLNFKCPTLEASQSLFNVQRGLAFDHIELLSGMCLFSGHIVQSSVPDDGSLDVGKLMEAKATLYEMEYIARSTSVIADLAAVLVAKKRVIREQSRYPSSKPICISLDVPSFHYYQSIEERLDRGLCTTIEALRWFDAVQRRRDQVALVFETALDEELRGRGVTSQECQSTSSSRLTAVGSYIRRSLESGRQPALKEVNEELNSQGDEQWHNFYKLLSPKERPQSFRELGYLFYVYHIVAPALQRNLLQSRHSCTQDTLPSARSSSSSLSTPFSNSETSFRPQNLLIGIDDLSERRIYSRAQEWLKKIRKLPDEFADSTLVETYLCNRVYTNNNDQRSNLYHDDQSPNRPILAERNRWNSKESRETNLEPREIIGKIYGHNSSARLQALFQEVGL